MVDYAKAPELASLTLGKATEYCDTYKPSLLQGVPRRLNRQDLGIVDKQPFFGQDLWFGYELSWLNAKGKPQVAIAEFHFSCHSPNLVESKSFKLYLNSFQQSTFASQQAVIDTLQRDLSACAGSAVRVSLHSPAKVSRFAPTPLPGRCLDELDIDIDCYNYNPALLGEPRPAQQLDCCWHSHLLKSNCLITGQPDWGSVIIRYRGPALSEAGLLRYLISFRSHNEFHEQCVERIFMDIWTRARPDYLSVHALYTRRGGLDINPFRSSRPEPMPLLRSFRQ